MFTEAHVLVVEDDERIRGLLAALLADTGVTVSTAAAADEAILLIGEDDVDVVLSDTSLRDGTGLDVLTAARARPIPPEVILLTAQPTVETSVAALRGGAFDYLPMPVDADELLAAVEEAAAERAASARRAAALRVLLEDLERPRLVRQLGGNGPVPARAEHGRYIDVGRLQIDTHRRSAAYDGHNLHVTPTEYALLLCLAQSLGRVVTSDEIVRKTHGYSASPADAQALLRGHVRNLRRKIPPGYVVTVRGSGYMLVAPEGRV
jgi:DNA-binding response OmpR family regulator